MGVHFPVISDGIFGYTVLPLFGQLKLSYRQIGGKTYNGKEKNHINNHSKKHDCFLEDSFWNDIESLMATTKGSILVSQSRTRE